MIDKKSIKITPEMLNFISKIDEFRGSWRTLNVLAPDRLLSLRHVATIESIGSSTRIEGSALSDKEVESILSNLTIGTFETRDEQEVAGYAHTMDLIFESWQEIPLSENHIQQLHKELLKFSTKDSHHRGKYKAISNNVSAFDADGNEIGVVFETASPFDTPQRMRELIIWTNKELEQKTLHPLLVIAIFTVVFLEVHPFQDGNGRLSRILTTMLLLKMGYSYVPYSSLESVVEQNKENYYLALRRTQATIRTTEPKWTFWIEFFLNSLTKQVINLEAKVEREKILLTALPELSLEILDQIKLQGRISMSEMIVLTGKNRNTLKDHFKALVKAEHIKLHGKGKGSWYSF